MGIMPLEFFNNVNRKKLNLVGSEIVNIIDIEKGIKPRSEVECEIQYIDGMSKKIKLLCRIYIENEIEYYKNGGILLYVLLQYDIIKGVKF
jgi:Aconitase A